MKKNNFGVKRLEMAIRLSEIAHKKALAEIKKQYPFASKEDQTKYYLGWIVHKKYVASFRAQ